MAVAGGSPRTSSYLIFAKNSAVQLVNGPSQASQHSPPPQTCPRDPLCALCDLKTHDLLSRGTLATLMCPHLFCFLQMKDPEELRSKGCLGFVNSAAAAAAELEFPV